MHEDQAGEQAWTILRLLRWATRYFESHQVESPRASAEILLAHVLGLERVSLYVRYDQPLMADELARYKALIRRRVRREPVAYITGEKAFWSITLGVTPDVLIPRPETECLVERALECLPGKAEPPWRVLDLGTGSGAIVLALVAERQGHRYFAADISFKSLQVARRNAERCGRGPDIRFFCGKWLGAVSSSIGIDLIVSNPPYIPARDIPGLQPEVRDYEPRLALDGGDDGLSAIREIIGQASRHLTPGGWLMMEIGWDQRTPIEAIVRQNGGFRSFACHADYAGHDRVAVLRK